MSLLLVLVLFVLTVALHEVYHLRKNNIAKKSGKYIDWSNVTSTRITSSKYAYINNN